RPPSALGCPCGASRPIGPGWLRSWAFRVVWISSATPSRPASSSRASRSSVAEPSSGTPPSAPDPERAAILDALRQVHDPDLHGDVVSLGFIRDLTIEGGAVAFELRLTTPACPAKEALEAACVDVVQAVEGVQTVSVRVTARTRGSL